MVNTQTASSPVVKKPRKRATPEAISNTPKSVLNWDTTNTPHFVGKEKQVEEFLNAALGDFKGYYATFMFSDAPGKTPRGHENLKIAARGCHGYMHSTAISGGWISAFRHTNQVDLNAEKVEEASLWYIEKFLLGKYSPWKVLVDRLTIVRNSHGIPVAYIVDGDENKAAIDKQLLQNFNIASRWPREFPGNVQRMYDLWKSGLFRMGEALLFHNLIQYSETSNTFRVIPSGLVGGSHHFYQDTNTIRLLERVPNSGMIFKGGRFKKVTESMSSDNDKFVWGYDKRDHSTLAHLFQELVGKTGKKLTTTFGGILSIISHEEIASYMEKFREFIESEIKRVPGGIFKEEGNYARPVNSESLSDYIGAYTRPEPNL